MDCDTRKMEHYVRRSAKMCKTGPTTRNDDVFVSDLFLPSCVASAAAAAVAAAADSFGYGWAKTRRHNENNNNSDSERR